MAASLAALGLGWWVDRSYLSAAWKGARSQREQRVEAERVEYRDVAQPQGAICKHGLYVSRQRGRVTAGPRSAFADGSQKNIALPIEANKLASPASAFPAAPLPTTD